VDVLEIENEMDYSHSGRGSEAGSYEHNNGQLGFLKGKEFFAI
jgi:hypothetical protein